MATRSPHREADGSVLPSPPKSAPEPQYPPPAPPLASLIAADGLSAAVSKAGAQARDAAPGRWYSWSGQMDPAPVDAPDGSHVVTGIVRRDRREVVMRRTAVGARLAAAALCLVAFSVLIADREKGWALDSYSNYKQFRYCVSVNVIGFVYSGFQLYALVHHIVMERHIIRRPMGDYFGFAIDQILAYLLISSSSSATARTDDWVSNWGRDTFPNMATGSIAVSFLAFLAFALSALISAHNLFRGSL